MPENWTGEVVGIMHVNRITVQKLANKLNYRPEYVSMILNGHRNPKKAEHTIKCALGELIQQEKGKV